MCYTEISLAVHALNKARRRVASLLAVPNQLVAVDRCVAWAMALHPRLGAHSPIARTLPPEVLVLVARLAWAAPGVSLVMDAHAMGSVRTEGCDWPPVARMGMYD